VQQIRQRRQRLPELRPRFLLDVRIIEIGPRRRNQ
jgi:hypothetical protein